MAPRGLPVARCKFVCTHKEESDSAVLLVLEPVTAGSEENRQFWAATPAGVLDLTITNKSAAAVFEQGAEYYLDIVKA